MNILTNKIKLSEEIKQLNDEKENYLKEITSLNEKVDELSAKVETYEMEYIHTGLECEFCYTVLKKEFVFCPKCGKKISKRQEEICVKTYDELFEIEEDKDGVLIIQYNGFHEKSIRIPATIQGRTVIGIWNGLFERCKELEEVYFEEGCKYIGKSVFANCENLKHVHLPKSLLEIGDRAFVGCGIEELAIPPNIKVIGTYAFSMRSLKRIVLPEGLKYISDGMLSNTSIEEIEIPQSVIHIGYYAFSGSKLKDVELPKNVYSIGKYAFDMKELRKIVIHSNVEAMDAEVFDKALRTTIYCAAGSKAQLYARKYGFECYEIAKQPACNVQTCAGVIEVEFGSFTKVISIEERYKFLGFGKAETWSWQYKNPFTIRISKTMEMSEAQEIRTKIEEFADSHSDWLKPGIACTIMNLYIGQVLCNSVV